ncbi:MAG: hypothetical protein LCH98_04715 [Actinobacteria bacterium]|nr:hypothetical protein [Actinomycetota bacterium]
MPTPISVAQSAVAQPEVDRSAVAQPEVGRSAVAQSTLGQPAAVEPPAARILADDAVDRVAPDLAQPVEVLLAGVLRGLRARAAAAPIDPVAALLADLAEAGLLDVGVDAARARVHGYGAAGSDSPPHGSAVTPDAVVAVLAQVCRVGAAAVLVQRAAIDVLTHARRTPANERLLNALRRGSVGAALPAPGEAPLDGELLVDGSVLVTGTSVRLLGVRPGVALLVRVRVGERVRWAWATRGTAGITVCDGGPAGTPGSAHGGVEVLLDRVILRADALIDTDIEPTTGPGAELLNGPDQEAQAA